MTVAELIAKLQKMPQDLPVISGAHCCSGDRGEVDATVEEDLWWLVPTPKALESRSGTAVVIE